MNYKQLTEHERYQIDAMNKAGHSQKEIAELLGRSASTISRELRRNRGLRGYRPAEAQRLSQARRREAHKARKVTTEVRGWPACSRQDSNAHSPGTQPGASCGLSGPTQALVPAPRDGLPTDLRG